MLNEKVNPSKLRIVQIMRPKLAVILLLNSLVFGFVTAGHTEAQTSRDWRENKTVHSSTIKTESLNFFDINRNRAVPVALYAPVETQKKKQKLAIISHGYGMKNTEYSFIAETLIAHGYFVASIQHEIAGDVPMPTIGKPSEVRRPF